MRAGHRAVSDRFRGRLGAIVGVSVPALLAVGALALPLPAGGAALDWIVIAGGSAPATTQVSLEQDAGLAREVLPGRGIVLFAGGQQVPAVQVIDRSLPRDPVRDPLGELFDPRDGRDARYRKPRIRVRAPATLASVRRHLRRALAEEDSPLLLYIATHGDMGESPLDNAILLWGGHALTVLDLAELLDRSARREVRLVMTSCHSGGFAELLFARADPRHGLPRFRRCGLFAAMWDEPASGCDPDPDRAVQEAYGLHFLHALRGEDRDGKGLRPEQIDFDGDGRISALEAHARARIASVSLDIPNSTSERWLRETAPRSGPRRRVELPEERAVIRSLSERLGVSGRAAAETLRQRLDQEWEAAAATADDAWAAADQAAADLVMALLDRWPVLDDPWHPLFPGMLRDNRKAIQRFLASSPAARRYRERSQEARRREAAADALRVRRAVATRLVRSFETVELAERLAAAGGEAWRRYTELRRCEAGFGIAAGSPSGSEGGEAVSRP